jgi:hypothetical protein
MYLYHKWDVKNDLPYVLQFFSLISDGLGSVIRQCCVDVFLGQLLAIRQSANYHTWERLLFSAQDFNFLLIWGSN